MITENLNKITPKKLIPLTYLVLSRSVDKNNEDFKSMVASIIDHINSNEEVIRAIDDQNFLKWKINAINQIVEKDYDKKINVDMTNFMDNERKHK